MSYWRENHLPQSTVAPVEGTKA